MKDKNGGEGNKTADRNYREGVRKHLKSHDVSSEGRKAAQALDDAKQGKELRKAEAEARKPRK